MTRAADKRSAFPHAHHVREDRTERDRKRRDLVRNPVRHRPGEPAPPRLRVVGHMVATEGDRDTGCARYGDCLAAHVASHRRSDPPASCPPGCRFRAATVERATDFAGGVSHLADAGRWRNW